MKNILGFVAKHWLTLGLLIGSLVLVVWIVRTQRAPGSMTVIEAQAMDMTTSKPPTGVQPVAVEEVAMRRVSSSATFPATVSALTDEDVVARVPGRVSKVLVYPGDRVQPGRLVATLDAAEIGSQAAESSLMATSKWHMALGSEHDVEERIAMQRRAAAAIGGARASAQKSQAELAGAQAERQQSEADRAAMQADVAEAQAQVRYAEQELGREQRLYKAGAVSLDELQTATKERDMAAARVRAAQAKAKAADQAVGVASRKIQAARDMVAESASMVTQAQADLAAAATAVAKARHDQQVAQEEAKAFGAAASAGNVTAGYRNLRTLSGGVVTERTVSPGTAVMPGQVVVKIKAIDTVRVQADLPQTLFGTVREGTGATLIVGDRSRPAVIGSVFPMVDEASRTFKVEARVPNRDHAFAVGMYGKLRVDVGASDESLAVRNAAVQSDADGTHYVWVVDEKAGGATTDWTCTMHPEVSEPGPGKCPKCGMDLVPRERSGKFVATKREIQTGDTDGAYTAVRSGLKAGEKVIWAGFENLQPGMAVQPTEWGPDGPKTLPQGNGGGMEGMPGMGDQQKSSSGGMQDMPGMGGPKPKPEPEPKPEPKPESKPDEKGGDMKDMPGMGHAESTPSSLVSYICPMKCKGSASAKPGACPVCGMKLVKVEKAARHAS